MIDKLLNRIADWCLAGVDWWPKEEEQWTNQPTLS